MSQLTIVIPTRNRAHTAIWCVRNALMLTGDIQVLVQDCSDTRQLEADLGGIGDPRLSYEHAPPTSMTDNWNKAFARSTGDVVCYIGDDDGVMPGVERIIAHIAARGTFTALVSAEPALYSWPDYPVAADAGVARFRHHHGPVVSQTVSGRDMIVATMIDPGKFGFLPKIYHGFVGRDYMERIRARTGEYFSTMNPDWYSYYMLAGLIEQYEVVDVPLTVIGRSASSNTGKYVKNRFESDHMNEYSPENRYFDKAIPPVTTIECLLGDGIVKALRQIDDPKFVRLFDRNYIPEMYARSILRNPKKALKVISYLHRTALADNPAGVRALILLKTLQSVAAITGRRVRDALPFARAHTATEQASASAIHICEAVDAILDAQPTLKAIAAGGAVTLAAA